ncbi:hypothetical protein SHIRM173S_11366 [Streptomyces hirsutus]
MTGGHPLWLREGSARYGWSMSSNGGARHGAADEPTSFGLQPPNPNPNPPASVPHPGNPYAAPTQVVPQQSQQQPQPHQKTGAAPGRRCRRLRRHRRSRPAMSRRSPSRRRPRRRRLIAGRGGGRRRQGAETGRHQRLPWIGMGVRGARTRRLDRGRCRPPSCPVVLGPPSRTRTRPRVGTCAAMGPPTACSRPPRRSSSRTWLAHVQGEEPTRSVGSSSDRWSSSPPSGRPAASRAPPPTCGPSAFCCTPSRAGPSRSAVSTPESTLAAITAEDTPEPKQAGALGPLIVRLLAKDPEERPDAEEVAGVLEAATKGRPAPATHGTRGQESGHLRRTPPGHLSRRQAAGTVRPGRSVPAATPAPVRDDRPRAPAPGPAPGPGPGPGPAPAPGPRPEPGSEPIHEPEPKPVPEPERKREPVPESECEAVPERGPEAESFTRRLFRPALVAALGALLAGGLWAAATLASDTGSAAERTGRATASTTATTSASAPAAPAAPAGPALAPGRLTARPPWPPSSTSPAAIGSSPVKPARATGPAPSPTRPTTTDPAASRGSASPGGTALPGPHGAGAARARGLGNVRQGGAYAVHPYQLPGPRSRPRRDDRRYGGASSRLVRRAADPPPTAAPCTNSVPTCPRAALGRSSGRRCSRAPATGSRSGRSDHQRPDQRVCCQLSLAWWVSGP